MFARPICFRLFVHWVRAAASRTFCTAGTSKAIKMAMMAITTSNSISVNPRRNHAFLCNLLERDMRFLRKRDEERESFVSESKRARNPIHRWPGQASKGRKPKFDDHQR